MTTYLFFVSAEEAKDGTKTGFGYAISKRSEWVQKNISDSDIGCVYVTGLEHGQDYIVYDNVVYAVYKKYVNVDENYVVVICRESEYGCDTKVF